MCCNLYLISCIPLIKNKNLRLLIQGSNLEKNNPVLLRDINLKISFVTYESVRFGRPPCRSFTLQFTFNNLTQPLIDRSP